MDTRMNLSQDNLYLTVTTPLGDDTLQLRTMHGEEQLSGLFHYTLELVSAQNNLDFASIVGQGLTVPSLMATTSSLPAATEPNRTRYGR